MLSRGFRRTWSTALAFARTTSFMPGFSQPILSDSVNADVGGLVSRRVKWSMGVGYSRNSVGFESSGTFATYSGGSRIEYALNDRFGLFGQDLTTATATRVTSRGGRCRSLLGRLRPLA